MIYKEIHIRNFINHNVHDSPILNIWNEVYVLANTFLKTF